MKIERQNEHDRIKQMDIWEDNVSIALCTRGHLEAELDKNANMDRAKKRIMRYHWLENTLFFQNLVVLRPTKCKMLIRRYMKKSNILGQCTHLLR